LTIPDAAAAAAYRGTFEQMLKALRQRLGGCRTVYTHNPWGEYGHADHVQVYRVACALAKEIGFTHLFSNYVAPKSMTLALPYLLETGHAESLCYPTNIALAHEVRALYVREDCWTVPDNFSWPAFENFNAIAAPEDADTGANHALLFPLNFIPWRHRIDDRKGFAQSVSRKLRRIKNFARGSMAAD
jgi:LmbE family N-acetylglucosaminyl deacetylase